VIKGFKDFVLRGNVVDLAVAVAIGTAFTAVVTAFTKNVIDPLIALVGGVEDLGAGFHLRQGDKATFVDLGAVLTAVVNFVIVAAVVYFVVVVPVNALLERRRRGEEPEAVATPEDIALLQEIRDLLKVRGGRL
jgi:large conductance mechanosensitive channel